MCVDADLSDAYPRDGRKKSIVLMRAGITNLAVHLALGTLAGVAIPMAVYLAALRVGVAQAARGPPWPGRRAIAHAQAA
ncbi:hypothetical protein BDAG_03180 [Burkholderia dolosa AU0158]|nr:hypothetical protein BDAG_03180 [Burkholderia dolosa AU0158]